jgi:hypothetical protein
MTKNQKILLGVGAVVLVGTAVGIGIYSSKKKKREEQARQEEYLRSLENNQGGGGTTTTSTGGGSTTGGNLATILGGLGTLWKNRPKKKDPRDVDPITTTKVTKIDNTPTVAKPNWNLAFTGFDGGNDYMEVGSELDDLN